LLFEDQLEALFTANVLLVGLMLLATGVLLTLTVFIHPKEHEISYKHAFIVGLAQAVAVLPGISRSGATIATGLMLGISKERMARFSFLMVIPPIVGKTLLDVKDILSGEVAQVDSYLPLWIGFVAAFVTGLVACTWMIEIVKRQRIQYFAIYCFIVGIIAIVVSWS
jgi:undecaprenyl-diphosphatase